MLSRNLDAFQRVKFRVARSLRPATWGETCDGPNRPAHQALYGNTAARASVAYSGTYCATAAHQVARGNAAGHKSKTRAGTAAEPMPSLHHAASRSERTCEQPQARGHSCWRDHRLPGMAGGRAELVANW